MPGSRSLVWYRAERQTTAGEEAVGTHYTYIIQGLLSISISQSPSHRLSPDQITGVLPTCNSAQPSSELHNRYFVCYVYISPHLLPPPSQPRRGSDNADADAGWMDVIYPPLQPPNAHQLPPHPIIHTPPPPPPSPFLKPQTPPPHQKKKKGFAHVKHKNQNQKRTRRTHNAHISFKTKQDQKNKAG